jgi:hypothetical protein
MTEFIGTYLQLQLVITAHTLRTPSECRLKSLCEKSLTALNDVCLTNEFLKSLHGSLYRLARIRGNPCK